MHGGTPARLACVGALARRVVLKGPEQRPLRVVQKVGPKEIITPARPHASSRFAAWHRFAAQALGGSGARPLRSFGHGSGGNGVEIRCGNRGFKPRSPARSIALA